jgi:hypothetical protein
LIWGSAVTVYANCHHYADREALDDEKKPNGRLRWVLQRDDRQRKSAPAGSVWRRAASHCLDDLAVVDPLQVADVMPRFARPSGRQLANNIV